MPSNHLILYHPLLLLSSIFPSIRVFSNESTLHSRWPKYWSFSFSINPSNECSGLISFRIDWSPRDSQEFSPTPQFKSINSLALSLLYGPTLTSGHDYWKNHSFDYIDLYIIGKWCLWFSICCLGSPRRLWDSHLTQITIFLFIQVLNLIWHTLHVPFIKKLLWKKNQKWEFPQRCLFCIKVLLLSIFIWRQFHSFLLLKLLREKILGEELHLSSYFHPWKQGPEERTQVPIS